MRTIIEEHLQAIIGLPWWGGSRVGSKWQAFQFGARRMLPHLKRRGKREVGTYALHIQCAWRIVSTEAIIVGWHDKYYPTGDDPFDEPPDFNWDHPGGNRCDERVQRLLDASSSSPLIVIGVEADVFGDFRVLFTGGYQLQTFHDDSLGLERELWRFFQPGYDAPHFVVTGGGVEEEEEIDEQ